MYIQERTARRMIITPSATHNINTACVQSEHMYWHAILLALNKLQDQATLPNSIVCVCKSPGEANVRSTQSINIRSTYILDK